MNDFSRGSAPREGVGRFVRFLAVGGLNMAVGYALFAGLLFVGLPVTGALALATVLGVLFNYQSVGRLVFGGDGRDGTLVAFALVYGAQFMLNLAALRLLAAAGLSAFLAQALVLPVLAVMTFFALRRWVFRAR